MENFLEKGWWQTGELDTVIQQHPNIKNYMKELLLEVNPSLIIEIGTSFGGLTVVLSELIKELNLATELHSYDPHARGGVPELAQHYGFTFIEKAVMVQETDDEIKSKIQNTPGRVLVLCDGGGKPYEFTTFSSALKPGDVIGGHDYADDREDYDNRVAGKLWNWFELEYRHVENAIQDDNLQDLPNELTQKGKEVVWLFKTKTS
jgi:hypothetical protein